MLTMGELISDFVNEHKKVKKMIEKTLSKVGGGCKIYLSSSIYKSKEEERKRRVLEAEKKKAEEAKRKELYDLMKVNRRSMKNGRCFAHDSFSPGRIIARLLLAWSFVSGELSGINMM